MTVVTVPITIGGRASPPPPSGSPRPVAVPAALTLDPGVPATLEIKRDDGTGALGPLGGLPLTDNNGNPLNPELPTWQVVPFWGAGDPGIIASVNGHVVTLTAPLTAIQGTKVVLSIDVR